MLRILLHDFCHRRLLVTDPLLSGSSGLRHRAEDGWPVSGGIGIETVHPEFVDVGLAELMATSSPAGRSHNAAENIFSSTMLNNDYRHTITNSTKNTIFQAMIGSESVDNDQILLTKYW